MRVLGWLFSGSRVDKKKVEEKFEVQNEIDRKIRKINLLRQALMGIEQNQRKLKLKFERDLREYDRRKRTLEKKLEFCSNEIEAEEYRGDIEGYDKLINGIKEYLKVVQSRIAKIKRILRMLDLVEIDLQAVTETNLPKVIDEFLEEFLEEREEREFDRDLDYQLNKLYEELDRILRNIKEKDYVVWLDVIDSEKDKEKEDAQA